MYGTVARVHPLPGKEDEVRAYFRYWETERRLHVPGAIGGYAVHLEKEPGTWVFVYAFQDKASYMANAESPEMDRDYQRLRALLNDDPLWEDGEALAF